jgi:hypothetical protein
MPAPVKIPWCLQRIAGFPQRCIRGSQSRSEAFEIFQRAR